jgi:archaemetzincin
MLGLRHCILYECNMNGSNHRAEADAQPLALCPECVPKLWWGLGLDPAARYRTLEALCRRHGLLAEADVYALSCRTVETVLKAEGPKRGD